MAVRDRTLWQRVAPVGRAIGPAAAVSRSWKHDLTGERRGRFRVAPSLRADFVSTIRAASNDFEGAAPVAFRACRGVESPEAPREMANHVQNPAP